MPTALLLIPAVWLLGILVTLILKRAAGADQHHDAGIFTPQYDRLERRRLGLPELEDTAPCDD